MYQAFKKAIKFFIYEFIVFGVIYDFLIVADVWPKNVDPLVFLVILLVVFIAQWMILYSKSRKE